MPRKCQLFSKAVAYLGDVAFPKRLKMAPCSTDTILGQKAYNNLMNLRSRLASRNVLRQFVTSFACLLVPWNKRLRYDQPVQYDSLNKKELESVMLLKNAHISPPLLKQRNSTGCIAVNTYACNVHADYRMLQIQPGK